jgi:hypothetical protein
MILKNPILASLNPRHRRPKPRAKQSPAHPLPQRRNPHLPPLLRERGRLRRSITIGNPTSVRRLVAEYITGFLQEEVAVFTYVCKVNRATLAHHQCIAALAPGMHDHDGLLSIKAVLPHRYSSWYNVTKCTEMPRAFQLEGGHHQRTVISILLINHRPT